MANRLGGSLSPGQMELLCQLRWFRQKHNYSPTLEELGQMMGISKVSVYQRVRALEQKGLVRRLRHQARSLELTDQATKQLPLLHDEPNPLKLVGRLGRNREIKFFSKPKSVQTELLAQRYKDATLLKVTGPFMADRGICDGDYLIVKPFDHQPAHQTVLLHLPNGQVDLREIYRRKNSFYLSLHKDRDDADVQVLPAEILGVIVGLLRSY